MRHTPEIINTLKAYEVFVFGSNESGVHGAGAAKVALNKFGALYGVGFGLQGKSFAIPTKDWSIETLSLGDISAYVKRFIAFAELHVELDFYVTKIGCGLAGLKIEDVAPMFISARKFKNVIFPVEFSDYFRDWERRSKLP